MRPPSRKRQTRIAFDSTTNPSVSGSSSPISIPAPSYVSTQTPAQVSSTTLIPALVTYTGSQRHKSNSSSGYNGTMGTGTATKKIKVESSSPLRSARLSRSMPRLGSGSTPDLKGWLGNGMDKDNRSNTIRKNRGIDAEGRKETRSTTLDGRMMVAEKKRQTRLSTRPRDTTNSERVSDIAKNVVASSNDENCSTSSSSSDPLNALATPRRNTSSIPSSGLFGKKRAKVIRLESESDSSSLEESRSGIADRVTIGRHGEDEENKQIRQGTANTKSFEEKPKPSETPIRTSGTVINTPMSLSDESIAAAKSRSIRRNRRISKDSGDGRISSENIDKTVSGSEANLNTSEKNISIVAVRVDSDASGGSEGDNPIYTPGIRQIDVEEDDIKSEQRNVSRRQSRRLKGLHANNLVINDTNRGKDKKRRPAPNADVNGIGEAESSGDDITVSSPARKRARRTSAITSTVDSTNASRDQDAIDRLRPPDESDSSEGVQYKGRRRVVQENKDDRTDGKGDEYEEDEYEEVPILRRRVGVQQYQKSRRSKKDAQEKEDIEEDLEDLRSSPPLLTSSRRHSSALNPKQRARQEALDLLKRRRAGERTGAVDINKNSKSATDQQNQLNSQSSDTENVHSDTDFAYPTAQDVFGINEYDEDFLAEDDDDSNNVEGPIGIPIEFTSMSSRSAKDLFKYAVEWMVQKRLNPGFALDDEVYNLTFKRLKDEAMGLGSLKHTSAAWTGAFRRALDARPEIAYGPLAKIDREGILGLGGKCDACNRRGHPPTWWVRFEGKVYDKETLEDISDGEEGDDEDGDEDGEGRRGERDSKGNLVPPASTMFNLGRFCMQNARVAHPLAHWRRNLNDWIVDYLTSEGYLTPEKIVERDRWSTRRKREYANEIVDEMEKTGEVRRLWKDFRREVGEVRTGKQYGWNDVDN